MKSFKRYFLYLKIISRRWLKRKYQSACLYCFLLSFIKKYKKVLLFPCAILLSYSLLFITSIGVIYLFFRPQMIPINLELWIQKFGFHWYYLFFILIYYGFCNIFLTYFSLSLTSYIGYELKGLKSSFLSNFKIAFQRWWHILWGVLIGNLYLSGVSLWNLISGRNKLDRLSRLLILPIVTFEKKQGLDAVKQSNDLMQHPYLRNEIIRFSFSWIPGIFLIFLLILLMVSSFCIDSYVLRSTLCFGLIGLFILSATLNLTICVIFQTCLYLDHKKFFNFSKFKPNSTY